MRVCAVTYRAHEERDRDGLLRARHDGDWGGRVRCVNDVCDENSQTAHSESLAKVRRVFDGRDHERSDVMSGTMKVSWLQLG